MPCVTERCPNQFGLDPPRAKKSRPPRRQVGASASTPPPSARRARARARFAALGGGAQPPFATPPAWRAAARSARSHALLGVPGRRAARGCARPPNGAARPRADIRSRRTSASQTLWFPSSFTRPRRGAREERDDRHLRGRRARGPDPWSTAPGNNVLCRGRCRTSSEPPNPQAAVCVPHSSTPPTAHSRAPRPREDGKVAVRDGALRVVDTTRSGAGSSLVAERIPWRRALLASGGTERRAAAARERRSGASPRGAAERCQASRRMPGGWSRRRGRASGRPPAYRAHRGGADRRAGGRTTRAEGRRRRRGGGADPSPRGDRAPPRRRPEACCRRHEDGKFARHLALVDGRAPRRRRWRRRKHRRPDFSHPISRRDADARRVPRAGRLPARDARLGWLTPARSSARAWSTASSTSSRATARRPRCARRRRASSWR